MWILYLQWGCGTIEHYCDACCSDASVKELHMVVAWTQHVQASATTANFKAIFHLHVWDTLLPELNLQQPNASKIQLQSKTNKRDYQSSICIPYQPNVSKIQPEGIIVATKSQCLKWLFTSFILKPWSSVQLGKQTCMSWKNKTTWQAISNQANFQLCTICFLNDFRAKPLESPKVLEIACNCLVHVLHLHNTT